MRVVVISEIFKQILKHACVQHSYKKNCLQCYIITSLKNYLDCKNRVSVLYKQFKQIISKKSFYVEFTKLLFAIVAVFICLLM